MCFCTAQRGAGENKLTSDFMRHTGCQRPFYLRPRGDSQQGQLVFFGSDRPENTLHKFGLGHS